jgi:hypothetical protein
MRDEVARAGVNLNSTPTIADLARDLPAAAEAAPERAPTVTIPRADTPRAGAAARFADGRGAWCC